MKTESQIKRKLHQVKFRALKRYLEKNLARVPGNCTFNATVETTQGRLPQVCTHNNQYGSERSVRICDSRVDGCDRAEDCPWFEPRLSKDELKETFKVEVGPGANIGQIAAEHPDMAALIWVLGSHESDDPEVDLGQKADQAAEKLVQVRKARETESDKSWDRDGPGNASGKTDVVITDGVTVDVSETLKPKNTIDAAILAAADTTDAEDAEADGA